MTVNDSKEKKYVINFLLGCALLVLGSALVGNDPLDYLYFAFIISCLIRYLIICNKE